MTDMLQKSENVAKNVANKKSQDLTSQWKKGELPPGLYYGADYAGFTHFYMFDAWTMRYLTGMPATNIKEIVATVPSYKEWQALKASYEMSNDANLKQATWMVDMEKENAQLKELLKECKDVILDYNNWIMSASPKDSELMLRIDEVLK